MNIRLSTEDPRKIKADFILLACSEEKRLSAIPDRDVEKAIAGYLSRYKTKELNREILIQTPRGWQSPILLYPLSLIKYLNVWEALKTVASRAYDLARDTGQREIAFLLNGDDALPFIGKVAEGFTIGSYQFSKYLSVDRNTPFRNALQVTLLIQPRIRSEAEERLERYKVVSEIVNECRDVVNEPGSEVYPEILADIGKKIAKEGCLDYEILNEKDLKEKGYLGLVRVGSGSKHPPRMIILRYKPKKKSPHKLALVGKGITFDSGGISLKPAEKMYEMKGDMSGAAAVLYTMKAISKLKPGIEVLGIVPTAENMPDSNAQRPGDIFRAKNGKTVMVDNTDAEGRLILLDALIRAKEEKASHILDIATLTGACARALGPSVSGVMGNDPHFISCLRKSGTHHGEAFWELPLVEEYKEMIQIPYADVNNVGGVLGGAITAGLFLQEFVPEGTPWVHLDIAGTFFTEKKRAYYKEGATGIGVKTMVDLCERFGEYYTS